MAIQVRYFASVREALGPGETVPHVAGETMAALQARLSSASDRHAEALAPGRALRCALNQALCAADAVVPDQAEVAFFPPVTGG